jgi:hypothetical protein
MGDDMLMGLIDNDGLRVPFSKVEDGSWGGNWLPIIRNIAARQEYCDVSATMLAQPFRLSVLQQRNDYYVRPGIMLPALFGKCFHNMLAMQTFDGLVERQFTTNIDGIVFGGTPDHFNAGVLTDYKTSKVYRHTAITNKGIVAAYPEWCWQMNIYRYLLAVHGHKVKRIQVVVYYLDYSLATKAQGRYKVYPDEQYMTYNMPLMDDLKANVHKRLTEYLYWMGNRTLPPPCEERWNKDSRCLYYCPVNAFCDYWVGLQNAPF